VTKRGIIEELLARHPNLQLREAEILVNATFDTMADTLAAGGRIELRGFGSFGVKQRSARNARNPKTGAVVTVVAKSIPFFRAAKELRVVVSAAPSATGAPPDPAGPK
jgi:integration host factor subunit beta